VRVAANGTYSGDFVYGGDGDDQLRSAIVTSDGNFLLTVFLILRPMAMLQRSIKVGMIFGWLN